MWAFLPCGHASSQARRHRRATAHSRRADWPSSIRRVGVSCPSRISGAQDFPPPRVVRKRRKLSAGYRQWFTKAQTQAIPYPPPPRRSTRRGHGSRVRQTRKGGPAPSDRDTTRGRMAFGASSSWQHYARCQPCRQPLPWPFKASKALANLVGSPYVTLTEWSRVPTPRSCLRRLTHSSVVPTNPN